MTFQIISRTEVGLPPVVRGSSGTPRPPLSLEEWMIAHYTGNNIDYTGKDAAEITRQIERVFSASKPNEYNYVIGQNEDPFIIEYAGKFQAAHSAGENGDSFGVLFLLGVGEPMTDLMVRKWQWLRDVLIFTGALRPDVKQIGHGDAPGARTSCPGRVSERMPEMVLPYKPTPTLEPTPPHWETHAMDILLKPPTSLLGPGAPWLVRMNGALRYAVYPDLDTALTPSIADPANPSRAREWTFPDTVEGRKQYRDAVAMVFGPTRKVPGKV